MEHQLLAGSWPLVQLVELKRNKTPNVLVDTPRKEAPGLKKRRLLPLEMSELWTFMSQCE